MKHQAYFDRALKSRDTRFARIFDKMGYRTTDMVAAEPAPVAEVDIAALRADYQRLFGTKPYMGWDASVLTTKIAEKRAAA
jgi:hypothetical protein